MNGRIHPSDRLLVCAVLLFIAATIAGRFDSLLFQPEEGKVRNVVFIPAVVVVGGFFRRLFSQNKGAEMSGGLFCFLPTQQQLIIRDCPDDKARHHLSAWHNGP